MERTTLIGTLRKISADERTELLKSYGIKAYACHPLLGYL